MTNVKIKQETTSGRGTHVYLDDREVHGVTGIDYSLSTDSLPEVSLSVIPKKFDLDAFVDAIRIDISDIQSAAMCLKMAMRLDEDFRKAAISSVKSAIDEVREKNQTDVVNDYELARVILDRIFDMEGM